MRTRKLGNSELGLSAIGFGAWAIGGGDYQFGWGPQDDKESIEAIHRALDLGINWIDTAAVYGLGRSEEVVGRAIAGRRDKVIVATKCALVWDEKRQTGNRLKASSVKKECEDSLRRLNTDVIDLYQIHWPNPDEDIEEGWRAVNDLVKEGKVRYGGVSNFSAAQMERVSKIAPIASLQPPYSLLNRAVETEILPYCGKNNIGVVAYSPMASGLLAGKFDEERVTRLPDEDWRKKYNENFKQPKLEKNLAFVKELSEIARDFGRSVSHLAIAWVLRRPEVTSAIVGSRNARQVEETTGAWDWELEPETIDRVEAAYKKCLLQ